MASTTNTTSMAPERMLLALPSPSRWRVDITLPEPPSRPPGSVIGVATGAEMEQWTAENFHGGAPAGEDQPLTDCRTKGIAKTASPRQAHVCDYAFTSSRGARARLRIPFAATIRRFCA